MPGGRGSQVGRLCEGGDKSARRPHFMQVRQAVRKKAQAGARGRQKTSVPARTDKVIGTDVSGDHEFKSLQFCRRSFIPPLKKSPKNGIINVVKPQ